MDILCRTGVRRSILLLVPLVALVVGLLAAPASAAVLPPPGNLLTWASFDGYAGTDDQFRDAVRGPGGSVFACGIDSAGQLTSDMVLVKYDTGGGKIWSYGGKPDGALSAEAYMVAVDTQGDAAVAGRAWNGGNEDWCVFKVNAAGAKLWWATRAGALDTFDSPSGVATDHSGNVIVSGEMDDSAKAVVVKYAAAADPAHPQTGLERWTNTVKAASGGEASTDGLAVDGSGNVYVAGQRTAANGHYDVFLRKIRPGGSTVWTQWWDGRSHGNDEPYGIVLRGGRLFIYGKTAVPGHKTDLLLLRYTTAGRLLWARTWDDAEHHDDDPWDLAVDSSGDAYVLGETNPTATTYSGVLVKWSATGLRRWVRTYRGVTGDGGAEFRSLEVGSSGTAWVSGQLLAGSSSQALALRYSAAGKRVWVFKWIPPGCDSGAFWTSALSGADYLFGAGIMHKSLADDDALGAWIVR